MLLGSEARLPSLLIATLDADHRSSAAKANAKRAKPFVTIHTVQSLLQRYAALQRFLDIGSVNIPYNRSVPGTLALQHTEAAGSAGRQHKDLSVCVCVCVCVRACVCAEHGQAGH